MSVLSDRLLGLKKQKNLIHVKKRCFSIELTPATKIYLLLHNLR
jgi:hypothetical protein